MRVCYESFPKFAMNRSPKEHYVVFSDLDGTLLDHYSYSFEESQPGIDILKRKNIPLVLVSSKTVEEMKLLHTRLKLSTPLVAENGAVFAFPKGDGKWDVEILGKSTGELKGLLPILIHQIGRDVKCLPDMTPEDVMMYTGLDNENALIARNRKGSLPFICDDELNSNSVNLVTVNAALEKYGIAVTKGGRFYHLMDQSVSKGRAVLRMSEYFASLNGDKPAIVAIGDSQNDSSMIESAQYGYYVRKPNGLVEKSSSPNVDYSENIGPKGFTEIIKKIFGE